MKQSTECFLIIILKKWRVSSCLYPTFFLRPASDILTYAMGFI